MSENKSPYIPIDCNYYDRLEAWATLKENVVIIYMAGNLPSEIQGRITDLFVMESVEYLRLDNSIDIRLDQLISVNGISPPQHC